MKEDPTKTQARTRKRALRQIKSRLTRAGRDIKSLFKAIPRTSRRVGSVSTNATIFYDYQFTPFELESIEAEIQRILDTWLVGLDQAQYYQDDTEQAVRSGTLESLRDVNQELITAAIAGTLAASMPRNVSIETYLLSTEYQNNLNSFLQRGISEIKGISNKAANQIYQVINSGLLAGQSPRDINKAINKRIEVASSGAKRMINTEINRAYNSSKIDVIMRMNDLGVPMVGQHISALLDTTRRSHMDRHLKLFTAEQQLIWWNSPIKESGSGSNWINCHCSFNPKLKV